MHARIELPAAPTSPRRARHFVTSTLVADGQDALVDVAALLVTELVTNAVLHAGTAIEVTIDDADDNDVLRFTVSDGSALLPRQRRSSTAAATGRGLRLVETLAGAWHCSRLGAGKRVWFDLSAAALAREPDLSAWPDDDASWAVL